MHFRFPKRQRWVDWLLNQSGNDYLCKIDLSYIEDRFNLTRLNEDIPHFYEEALEMMIDQFDYRDYSEATRVAIENAAQHLYGLIHARYIITNSGMSQMIAKYKKGVFGVCPRHYCDDQPLLPVGLSDLPQKKTVKMYCPRCTDVYQCSSPNHINLDGAYFGTTFAHLLLQSDPTLINDTSFQRYTPRIYGFKIASSQ
ncbi:casein kinase II, regulatory subunit [Hesseltinella vesiculosa]|uniref:Casein kinase II subunit beta n=1 Tax=Hesseltinella vesiculosa TaxID=101127 RepID=A0A1X2GUL9_9FUNG|nr:casein kinase II, regulatory subunit [Hesseltinella vesiculosa]